MKKKFFSGLVAVFAVFALMGSVVISAKAADYSAKEEASQETTKESKDSGLFGQTIKLSEDDWTKWTGERFGMIVDAETIIKLIGTEHDVVVSTGGGDERHTYVCRETTTFNNGSSVTQTYGSNTNNSGTVCYPNGVEVSTSCSLNDIY